MPTQGSGSNSVPSPAIHPSGAPGTWRLLSPGGHWQLGSCEVSCCRPLSCSLGSWGPRRQQTRKVAVSPRTSVLLGGVSVSTWVPGEEALCLPSPWSGLTPQPWDPAGGRAEAGGVRRRTHPARASSRRPLLLNLDPNTDTDQPGGRKWSRKCGSVVGPEPAGPRASRAQSRQGPVQVLPPVPGFLPPLDHSNGAGTARPEAGGL